MNDDKVRTTITLPKKLHRQLRLQAIESGMTMGDLVVNKFVSRRSSRAKPQTRLTRTFRLFEEARQSGKQLIAREAVREERDSH